MRKETLLYYISLIIISILIILLRETRRNKNKINNTSKKEGNMENTSTNDINNKLQQYLSSWEREEYIKVDNPVEYWSKYWQSRISGNNADGKFFYFEITDDIVPVLRKLGLRKILCVGNGVSLEPLALAYAGFDVDVIDISQEAIDFISNYKLSESDIKRFYTQDQQQPGGTINYIVGDFTDRSICPGPYDVIITRRTLQYFTRSNFLGVLDLLIEKLTDEGIFVNHTHNAYDVGFAIEEYLRLHNFVIHNPNKELSKGKRIGWLFGSSG